MYLINISHTDYEYTCSSIASRNFILSFITELRNFMKNVYTYSNAHVQIWFHFKGKYL